MFKTVANQRVLLLVARGATRGFATHSTSVPYVARTAAPAVLHLKTGQSFTGRAFGSPKSIFGETVFSTSITSCQYPQH